MGLFINSNQQPNVYKNHKKLNEPNQDYLRVDYFSEILKEQRKVNDNLVTSFEDLHHKYDLQKRQQMNQWKDVGERLNELQESNLEHEEFERQAKQWLGALNESNEMLQEMVEKESSINRDMANQINVLSKSHNDVLNQLEQYETSNQELHKQMNQLMKYQKELLEQVTNQDEKQNKMIDQLENQEAIMEKTYRQVSHLRSVLYERAGFLADKIEESYNLMSSFFYNLVTGADPSLNLLLVKQKKDDDQRKVD